jgi:hypothetical protein
MRLNCTFETGDERYKWINEVVAIASSARCGNQGMELADVGTDHGQSSTTLTLLLEVRWHVQCIHVVAAMHGVCLLLLLLCCVGEGLRCCNSCPVATRGLGDLYSALSRLVFMFHVSKSNVSIDCSHLTVYIIHHVSPPLPTSQHQSQVRRPFRLGTCLHTPK